MKNTINIYAYAAINKLRFNTPKGPIATESLYDLPINSANGISLESVAAPIFGQLESAPKRSLTKSVTPVNEELEIKVAILEDVLEYKRALASAAQSNREKQARIAKLKAELLAKGDKKLTKM